MLEAAGQSVDGASQKRLAVGESELISCMGAILRLDNRIWQRWFVLSGTERRTVLPYCVMQIYDQISLKASTKYEFNVKKLV
jgi:hypothetical protein